MLIYLWKYTHHSTKNTVRVRRSIAKFTTQTQSFHTKAEIEVSKKIFRLSIIRWMQPSLELSILSIHINLHFRKTNFSTQKYLYSRIQFFIENRPPRTSLFLRIYLHLKGQYSSTEIPTQMHRLALVGEKKNRWKFEFSVSQNTRLSDLWKFRRMFFPTRPSSDREVFFYYLQLVFNNTMGINPCFLDLDYKTRYVQL